MTTNITTRQANAITELVASLRPDWDVRGIMAALRDAAELTTDPTRLAVAATLAAGDPSNRTPKVIGMRGKHWDAPTRSADPPVTNRCTKCRDWHQPAAPCSDPPSRHHGDHVAAMRTALTATRQALCSHGVRPQLCADHREQRQETSA